MCRSAFAAAGFVLICQLFIGPMNSISAGDAAPSSPAPSNPATDERLSRLVETIVREAIPRTFEETDDWAKRKKVFSGLDVETRGLGLRISKRERAVRHGFWRRYVITLIDPQEKLQLRIENVRSPEPGTIRADLFVRLRANVDVRFEHWNLGVKLLNAHSNADATLEVRADLSVKTSFEVDKMRGLPVFVAQPTVHRVDLSLPDLDVNRFGELRGSVAEELGNGLEDILEDLLQSQEKSIRKMLQKSLDKHADDLRIPLADLLGRWEIGDRR